MPTVVTGNCDGCRYTECVTACPVDCFRGDDRMLYIDQSECVDCRACIPACPVAAIYDVDELPADMMHWIAINETRAPSLPPVTAIQPALDGADRRRLQLGY